MPACGVVQAPEEGEERWCPATRLRDHREDAAQRSARDAALTRQADDLLGAGRPRPARRVAFDSLPDDGSPPPQVRPRAIFCSSLAQACRSPPAAAVQRGRLAIYTRRQRRRRKPSLTRLSWPLPSRGGGGGGRAARVRALPRSGAAAANESAGGALVAAADIVRHCGIPPHRPTPVQAVHASESTCQRSKASGVLVVTMPKVAPPTKSYFPSAVSAGCGALQATGCRRAAADVSLLASLTMPASRTAHCAAFEDSGEPPSLTA